MQAIRSPVRVDAAQYCNWSRQIFEQMREARLTAVCATVLYHGSLRETVDAIVAWNTRLRDNADVICPGLNAADIARAQQENRTAIFFGLQNPMPMEDDLGLLEILRALGIRFFQLTYNTQSLLGCGWTEPNDTGLTLMGREVVREMNRLGLVIDLSHAGEHTALQTIETSGRPVAISHANPFWWRQTRRNASNAMLEAIGATGGMLGLSLYPHHMQHGSETTLVEFCDMVVRLAGQIGVSRIGIGSDLCQDQPDTVVDWMREGRWIRPPSGAARATFPRQPPWFADCRGFDNLERGLLAAGFAQTDVDGILGNNWRTFIEAALAPQATKTLT